MSDTAEQREARPDFVRTAPTPLPQLTPRRYTRGKVVRITAAAAAASRPDDGAARLASLLGLRGFLLLPVLAFHAQWPWARDGWMLLGALFSLSGLLVASAALRTVEQGGEARLGQFYQRRIARIVPSAYLAVFAVCSYAICMRLFLPGELSGEEVYWLRWDMLAAAAFGSNAHLQVKGEDLFSLGPPSLLRHFWSVAVEEQFFLFFPMMLGACVGVFPMVFLTDGPSRAAPDPAQSLGPPQRHRCIYLGVLCCSVAVCWLSWWYGALLEQAGHPALDIQYSALCHAKEFAVGTAAAAAVRLIPPLQGLLLSDLPYDPKLSQIGISIVDVANLVLLALLLGWTGVVPVPFLGFEDSREAAAWFNLRGSVLISVAACLLLVGLAVLERESVVISPVESPRGCTLTLSALSSPPLVYCGSHSYLLYVVHVPVLVWTGAVFSGSWDNNYVASVVIATAVTVMASAAVSATVEYPAMAKILKSKDPRRVLAGLAAAALCLGALVVTTTNNYRTPPLPSALPMSPRISVPAAEIVRLRPGSRPVVPPSYAWGSHSVPAVREAWTAFQTCLAPQSDVAPANHTILLAPHLFQDRMSSTLQAALRSTINPRYCVRRASNTSVGHATCPNMLTYIPKLVATGKAAKAAKKPGKILIVTGPLSDGQQGGRYPCEFLNSLRSNAKKLSSSSFYFLHIHDTLYEKLAPSLLKSRCEGLPYSGGVLNKADRSGHVDRVVVVDLEAALRVGPLEALRNRTQQQVVDMWRDRNEDVLSELRQRYSVYSLLLAAANKMPELSTFFRCSVFNEYRGIVEYMAAFEKGGSLSASKEVIAYLGGTLAPRFAHLLEYSRTRLLKACGARFKDRAQADINSAPFLVLAKITFESLNNTQCSVISNRLCVDAKKLRSLAKVKHTSRVIVEDSSFVSNFLAEALKKKQWRYFRDLVQFLLELQTEHKIKRVYMHDLSPAHHAVAAQHTRKYNISEPDALYKRLVSTIASRFKECAVLISKWDSRQKSAPACIPRVLLVATPTRATNATRSEDVRRILKRTESMLRVLDVSRLLCPSPTQGNQSVVVCSAAAWGFNRLLPDGVHPAGPSGDFVAANLLAQLAVDIYFDAGVTKHRPSAETLKYKSYHSLNSSLTVRSISGHSSVGAEVTVPNSFLQAVRTFSRMGTCGKK